MNVLRWIYVLRVVKHTWYIFNKNPQNKTKTVVFQPFQLLTSNKMIFLYHIIPIIYANHAHPYTPDTIIYPPLYISVC